jgi:hypothetical protein
VQGVKAVIVNREISDIASERVVDMRSAYVGNNLMGGNSSSIALKNELADHQLMHV